METNNFAQAIFRNNPLVRPATYYRDYASAPNETSEISVIFNRSQYDGLGVVNADPEILVQTTEVPEISNRSKIVVHYGYWQAESGEGITDQAGQKIIAENEFTYFVRQYHADAAGVITVALSLNT